MSSVCVTWICRHWSIEDFEDILLKFINIYTISIQNRQWQFLPLHASVGMLTRGHSLKLLKKQCRTNLRRNCFTSRVVNTWNSMPEEIVQSTSVNCFKGRFDRFLGHLRYETDENKCLAPTLR